MTDRRESNAKSKMMNIPTLSDSVVLASCKTLLKFFIGMLLLNFSGPRVLQPASSKFPGDERLKW